MSEAYEIAEGIWKKQANGTLPMYAVGMNEAKLIVRIFVKNETEQVLDNVAENLVKISNERSRWRLCHCGSGEFRSSLYDARGIFVSFYCAKCEKEVRSKYRPEIFTDSSYDTYGEVVDEDRW